MAMHNKIFKFHAVFKLAVRSKSFETESMKPNLCKQFDHKHHKLHDVDLCAIAADDCMLHKLKWLWNA